MRNPGLIFIAVLLAVPALAGIGDLRIERNENEAFLGVFIEEAVGHPAGGALVTRVIDDTAAELAGLERGDVIVGLDGAEVHGPRGLGKEMERFEGGDTVRLRIVRDGAEQTLDVELGSREPRTTVHLDRPFHVVSEDTRGRIHGTMTLDDDDDLSEIFVCDAEDCKFSVDPVWYRLDCIDAGCPTYRVSYWGRPLLGVQVTEMTAELREHFGADEDAGLLVSKVYENSPAEFAGLETGDVIVAVAGRSIDSTSDMQRALKDTAGEIFDVEVVRDGRPLSLEAAMPDYDD